jgi:hypothetical protein
MPELHEEAWKKNVPTKYEPTVDISQASVCAPNKNKQMLKYIF